MAFCHSACVGLMDVPTDPTKEEVTPDAATARFPEIPSPLPSFDAATAVKLHKAKEEDEMGANIATRCSLCAVALGHMERGGQPVEVHMERGRISFNHCVLCEDTSLLLTEATDAQRSLAMRDRDSWLMTTGKFTELQGKFHRAPTVMELLVEVTSNLVGAARGQVKEEPPSMESAATAQGDGKELASAATAKGDAEHPSSSREGTKTFRSFWSQIKEEDALLFQEASQKKKMAIALKGRRWRCCKSSQATRRKKRDQMLMMAMIAPARMNSPSLHQVRRGKCPRAVCSEVWPGFETLPTAMCKGCKVWAGMVLSSFPPSKLCIVGCKTMTSGSWLAHTVMCRLGTSNAWPGCVPCWISTRHSPNG